MDDCIFIATKRIPDESFWSADRHVKKVTDLSLPEYKALMESVYHTAQAITDQFSPDKINYLIFGDTSTHLHVHIVPKYQNGKDWGKSFSY